MTVRVYVDANIYLDYFEDRADGLRPLGEFAFQIFKRALECEFEIVVSDWLIQELNKKITSKTKADLLFAELTKNKKLLYVLKSYDDFRKAKVYENFNDAMHAIIAQRTKCKFIVTRNITDFLCFSGLIQPKLPEHV